MSRNKKRFCKYCGCEIDSDKKICTGCGHTFFHIKKVPIVAILLILCITFGSISVYLYISNRSLQNELSYNKELVSKQRKTIENNAANYEKNYDQLLVIKGKYEMMLNRYKNDFAYVVANGVKYHTYDCTFIENSKSDIYCGTIQELREQGYSECSVCY